MFQSGPSCPRQEIKVKEARKGKLLTLGWPGSGDRMEELEEERGDTPFQLTPPVTFLP